MDEIEVIKIQTKRQWRFVKLSVLAGEPSLDISQRNVSKTLKNKQKGEICIGQQDIAIQKTAVLTISKKYTAKGDEDFSEDSRLTLI